MTPALEVFFDEARELLQALETGLLALEQGTDAETVNAVFRAAHTIKGSAGLVGLEQVVRFAHSMETVLDQVRGGHLGLDHAAISRLLEAKDHLRDLLGHAEAGTASPSDPALSEALVHLAGLAARPAPSAPSPAPSAPSPALSRFHVRVRFGPNVLRDGMDPLAMLRFLEKRATVSKLAVQFSCPPDASFEAERCYLTLDFEAAGTSREVLDETFEFVRDDSELSVEPIAVRTEQPTLHDSQGHAEHFIKVHADKLDALVNLVGELVIAGATSGLLAARTRDAALIESLSALNHYVEDIRDSALGLRMVPIGESFSRFRRVVRDASQALGKQIELEVRGGDTELDKAMVDRLADPLLHLVRNALDHGLETPEVRVAKGKSPTGHLVLEAFQESGSVVVEVRDDGGGLPRAKLVKKAIERGLIAPTAQLTDEEIVKLIFVPGFSSAEKVTDLSGRGVGMDVVKRNVDELRGTIDVESVEGQGTTIRLRLPLTLAIIDGFLFRVAKESFIVPLDLVRECIDLMPVLESEHNHRLDLRREAVAFIRLRELFGLSGERPGRESVIVVEYGDRALGLVVDRLVGASQTVIKPLGPLFRNTKGLGGSTILGSGEVALILDVPQLLSLAESTRASRAA